MKTFNESQSAEFAGKLQDAGLQVRSYSGRCMYGAHCISVTDRTEDIPLKLRSGMLTDSLGFGMVCYWPAMKWPDDDYEIDVRNYELEGMTRSDAQAVADAERM